METQLQSYIINFSSSIGEGGFARVFLGRNNFDGSIAAVKVLRPEFEHHSPVVESFFLDPVLVQGLSHPHIVTILQVGTPVDTPYFFAMEYCEGGDLKKMIQTSGHLPPGSVLNHLIPVCEALEYCHNHNLFHGDIKASNILFRSDGSPVLSDFGNAVQDLTRQSNRPREERRGSPPYLSPEVWNGEEYDQSSDLYSLGVLLYYALTGRFPFSGQSAEEYKRLHLSATPTPPSWWRPSIGGDLDEVVLALLEKDRRRRISSAAELGRRLATLRDTRYGPLHRPVHLKLVLDLTGSPADELPVTEFPFRIGKYDGNEGGLTNHLIAGMNDPYVSRHHALLDRGDDGFVFTDLSTNGSVVNGVRLRQQTVELAKENKIILGGSTDFTIKVVAGDPPGPDTGASPPGQETVDPPSGHRPNAAVVTGGAMVLGLMVLAVTRFSCGSMF